MVAGLGRTRTRLQWERSLLFSLPKVKSGENLAGLRGWRIVLFKD